MASIDSVKFCFATLIIACQFSLITSDGSAFETRNVNDSIHLPIDGHEFGTGSLNIPILFLSSFDHDIYGLAEAAKMAFDIINSSKSLFGNLTLEPKYLLSLSTLYETSGSQQIINEIQEGLQPVAIVTTDPSNAVDYQAYVSTFLHLPQITCQNLDYTVFSESAHPYMIAGRPSVLNILNAKRDMFAKFNWQRIGVVYDYLNERKLFTTVSRLRRHFGQAKLFIYGMDTSVYKSMADALVELKNKDVRIIMAEFESYKMADAKAFFCQVYRMGMYGERYVWLLARDVPAGFHKAAKSAEIPASDFCNDTEALMAADRHLFFGNIFLRKDDVRTLSGLTSQEFITRLRVLRSNALEQASLVFDSVFSLTLALKETANFYGNHSWIEDFQNRTRRPHISQTIMKFWRNVTFEGVSGRWVYNEFNDRAGDTDIILRLGDGTRESVGRHFYPNKIELQEGAENRMFFGSKIPTDGIQPVVTLERIGSDSATAFIAMAAIGIFLAVFFLGINVVFRNDKVIKMSSPKINTCIIFGSFLCYFSVIVHAAKARSSDLLQVGDLCNAWLFLLVVGFTLVFGALFAKTWRVYRIFNAARSLTKLGIKDVHLYFLIAALVLVDVIFLTVWVSFAPLAVVQKEISRTINLAADKEFITLTEDCACANEEALLITIAVFKGVFLIYGIFLAWQTREVEIEVLNDSKQIGFSVYLVSITSLLAVITVPALNGAHRFEASFVVLSMCVWTCTTVTLCLVFLPKVSILFSKSDERERATKRT